MTRILNDLNKSTTTTITPTTPTSLHTVGIYSIVVNLECCVHGRTEKGTFGLIPFNSQI